MPQRDRAEWDAVPWILVVPAAIVLEVFRAMTRRRLVEEWVRSQGWELHDLRYSFTPFGWNWLVYYRVEATDRRGGARSGVVYATGFIRREVDWSPMNNEE